MSNSFKFIARAGSYYKYDKVTLIMDMYNCIIENKYNASYFHKNYQIVIQKLLRLANEELPPDKAIITDISRN